MNFILPEIPRLHTALAEWSSCMIFVIVFRNRICGLKLAAVTAVTLLIQGVFQLFAGTLPIGFWIPAMVMAILFMFFFIYLSCRLSVYDAAYLCVRAFVLAEFAASLEWQIYCFLILGTESTYTELWKVLNLLVIYLVIFSIAFRLENRFAPVELHINVHLREVALAVIIGLAAFTMSNIGFVYSNTPFSARYDAEIFIIRTIVDFGGLAVLYAHYILNSELRNKQELDAIRNVLQRQYSQYELFKDNIELLNIKYHDLKNQIAVIRAEKDPEKRETYLSEMDQRIKIYEAQNRTGHQVLDTVLSSKSLLCVDNNIELTCVANGKLLDFMDAMDICTIFGNALDNAIESELLISEKEKRLIHVSVFSKNNFLMIRFENYFLGTLQATSGQLPETTKKNKDSHGYGLKSIRYSAERYGGSVTINQNNHWVELKVLIPLQ